MKLQSASTNKKVISGDEHCEKCKKKIKLGILCGTCNQFFHFRCAKIDPAVRDNDEMIVDWCCEHCRHNNDNEHMENNKVQSQYIQNLLDENKSLKAIIETLNKDKQDLENMNMELRNALQKMENEDHNLKQYSHVVRSNISKKSFSTNPRNVRSDFNLNVSNRFEVLGELSDTEHSGNKSRSSNNVETVQNCERREYRKQTKAIVLGDSILKYSGEVCKSKGYEVRCFPGINIAELKTKVENMDLRQKCPEVIVVHAGTNDIRKGVYAEEIMGDMMDLVGVIKSQVKDAKIVISGVLRRDDVTVQRTARINNELDWMCSVRNCLLVDGNSWLLNNDFARDGIHLNRRGSYKFGNLICNVVSSLLGNE